MPRSSPASLTRALLPLALLLLIPTAHAQHLPAHAHDSAATASHATAFPVTRVALYKNGVGFFEYTGRVSGNAQVTLDFTTSQLDDVLQSLTAIDLNGGRISGADYNSTTPLDQQLRNLALGLNPGRDREPPRRGQPRQLHHLVPHQLQRQPAPVHPQRKQP